MLCNIIVTLLLQQAHVAGSHVDVFGEAALAKKAAAEADAAGKRFKSIFGAAPVRGAVILTRDGKPAKDRDRDLAYAAHGAKWIWRWEAKASAEPDETMTHELGHLWLTFWADGLTPPKVKRYGSSLPDWLDEGVASLLEGPKAHRAYENEMRKRVDAGTAMPLADLLVCVHPDSREKTGNPKAADRWLFYVQTYSAVRFVVDAYGEPALRHIAITLKNGKGFDESLGVARLPRTRAEFESEWRTWAARR